MRLSYSLLAAAAAFALYGAGATGTDLLSAATTAGQPAGGTLFKNPVALQLYSFRDSFKTDGVPKTLAKVKAIGFTHVEMAGTYGMSREAFKAELDKAGLTPVSMHADIKVLSGDATQVLADAKFCLLYTSPSPRDS